MRQRNMAREGCGLANVFRAGGKPVACIADDKRGFAMSDVNLRHGFSCRRFTRRRRGRPDAMPRTRSRKLMVWLDKLPGFTRGVDRAAHHSAGYEIISSAEDLYRLRRRADATHQIRHWGRLAALSPSDDDRGPDRPARPHDARAGDVRRRGTGFLGVGRDHDGDRPDDPARPDGRVAGRDPAALQRRGHLPEDRLVHDGRVSAAFVAVYEAAARRSPSSAR